VIELPDELTNVPAAHVVHAVHALALLPVEYDPLRHAEHVRFVIVEPGRTTRSPGPHEVHATHAVAGFAS